MRAPLWLVPLALGIAAGTAFPGDPPATEKKPVPKRLPVVEIPGIHWEREFEGALPRAAAEGRPVLFAVNALVDAGERGNVEAATVHYPSKELGDASRPFVCLVCNPNDHEPKTLADGVVVCSRYGNGTCACHKAATSWVLSNLSSDGESVISPSHWILEPDGALASHGDFVQSTPTASDLDAWTVAISPRLAMRRVWTAREERLTALEKTSQLAGLEMAAIAWARSGDTLAPAGLAALLDEERDGGRRKAIAAGLKACGAAAVPPLFDIVDAGTSAPDADPETALFLADLAGGVDPEFGAYAAARVIVRTKDAKVRSRAIAAVAHAAPGTIVDEKALPPAVKARLAKAAAPDLAAAKGRDEVRTALDEASPEAVVAAKERIVAWLKHPAPDVRVAAAVALRRIGDVSGASVLLDALSDPVEGAEARVALAAIEGTDLGEDPGAWEEFLKAPRAGGGK